MSNETFSLRAVNKELLAFLSAALIVLDEAKIRLNDTGLHIRGVDPANVGMIQTDLTKNAFDAYTPSEQDVLGLNIERLYDFLKQADSDDTVTLALNPDSEKLEVKINDSLEFTQAPIDPDSIRQEPDIPEIEYISTIKVEGHDFNRGIAASDMVSDHVRMAVDADEKSYIMEADGDTDDVELTLKDEEDLEELNADESGSSLFSLDYLKDFKKLVGNDDIVKIELGDELPIKLHLQEDGHDNLGVTYMLAPRIESN